MDSLVMTPTSVSSMKKVEQQRKKSVKEKNDTLDFDFAG